MNVDWLYHLPRPIRVAGYFGLQELIGFHISKTWRDFQCWEKLSSEELNEAVEARLSALLSSAITNSAHYRKLGLIKKGDETAREFIRRFPILTRDQIRDRFNDLVVDSLREHVASHASVAAKRNDWLVVKTGGTTGVPTAVVHDMQFRDSGRATRVASQKLCGFPLGTRYFRLWGSEQDLLQQEDKIDRRILRNLLGEIPMNAFRAKDTEMRNHWETLRQHPEIQHMMAYVDAAASLASFIEDKGLARPKIKTIMACAGTVTDEWRQILQRVFQAEVFDKYGSRECADIACECSAHAGLHVFSPNVFLEIVDDAGQVCLPGQPGRILVTLLNNLSFPMIRYEIGDIGIWRKAEACPCSRPFPRLQSIQGRQDDMLSTQDGNWLSSVFVRHFVGVTLNRNLIREWQLEQVSPDKFIFRHVPIGGDGLEKNLQELEASFKTALGKNIVLQMEQMAEIPLSPTGKMRWIINRYKK